MDTVQFEGRKREHIQHALNPSHQAVGLGQLGRVHLVHEALPNLDFESIRLHSACLGKSLPTPFYVAGMTAGHGDAPKINQTLAKVCQKRGWALGVGSQRRELESAGSQLDEWKKLRATAPDVVLFANLGISQIIHSSIDDVKRVIDSIGAQALAVHVNALQEALQPEGTPQFKGALEALGTLCGKLGVPIILKETGCGFSIETLERVRGFGLAAVDVSGLGGTHWGRIEGARASSDSLQARASQTFANWGESTVESVIAARKAFPLGSATEIWASGGVRSGLDAAKLIALGATRVGYAQPALEAALQGEAELDQWMALQEYELRIALFCTGCGEPEILRKKETAWKAIAV